MLMILRSKIAEKRLLFLQATPNSTLRSVLANLNRHYRFRDLVDSADRKLIAFALFSGYTWRGSRATQYSVSSSLT